RVSVDAVVLDERRECGRREVVVDAPARVLVERLTAVRPPAEGALHLASEVAADVDAAETGAADHEGAGIAELADLAAGSAHLADDGLAGGAQELVEVRALAREEAGARHIALPVLDIELPVTDVEIARHDREFAELGEALHHGVEEDPLRLLPGGVDLARMHVGAHDGDGAVADPEVGLEPSALRVDAVAEAGAVRDGGLAGGDRDARAAL